MQSSLVKFFDRTRAPDGQKLFWSRADLDGVPFRGAGAPILSEEEYEHRVVRVSDFQFDFFDVAKPDEAKRFKDVWDCVLSGWFQFVHLERFHQGTTRHYMEWVEFYMQDGTRVPFSQGSLELSNGNIQFPADAHGR